MTCTGLPHSEIPGSKVICTSPKLIAAYHVLHRLLVPRHSPYALCSLTKNYYHKLLEVSYRGVFRVESAQAPSTQYYLDYYTGVNLYSIVKEQKPEWWG